jgi:two-component system chemotaxis response regulator CheY
MPWGLHTKDTPGNGRILIVDDDENVRKVLRVTLTDAGYDVVEADHGGTGIEQIRSGDNRLMVDVIICDIRMPQINGVEAIDYFLQQFPSVPILVLTGFPDTKMAAELLSKGVADYLVKPVDDDKLLAAVKAGVEQRLRLVQNH